MYLFLLVDLRLRVFLKFCYSLKRHAVALGAGASTPDGGYACACWRGQATAGSPDSDLQAQVAGTGVHADDLTHWLHAARLVRQLDSQWERPSNRH